MSPPTDHKLITEEELKEWEAMCHCSNCGNDTKEPMDRLISEVRGLRETLSWYATPGNWRRPAPPDLTTFEIVWDPPAKGADAENGYDRARDALGWGEPAESCENPSCDGVKDDLTDGERHRCFKDGRWLDTNEEM